MKQGLPKVGKHKVTVLSLTYNHSRYIEDTLKGFAMQQTNFAFLCCVFDDASTDGEQDVIRRWIENHCNPEDVEKYDYPLYIILMAPDKDNANCIYVIHLLKKNLFEKTEKKVLIEYWQHLGEYIALCEGDDYWIDPLKLQKQVDFLEINPEYVLIHSDFIALNVSTGQKIYNASYKYNIYDGDIFEKLFQGCFIRTPTICYRTVKLELSERDLPSNIFNGDLFLFYNLAYKGKFHFMKEETCVYRVLRESASHTCSEELRKSRWQRYKNLDYFIAHYFKVDSSIILKLDYKWFKIDLRNCIATKDYARLNGLILPDNNISFLYKFLYYCCKSRFMLLLLSTLLKFKVKMEYNKWF